VAQLLRDVFARLQHPEGTLGDIGRYLDHTAVRVEKAKAVAPARRLQRPRLGREPHAILGKLRCKHVDRRGVGDAERHEVDAVDGRLAHADDVLLR
jgi:hypothetical protein